MRTSLPLAIWRAFIKAMTQAMQQTRFSSLSADNGANIVNAGGSSNQGYRTHYKWDCGLTLRDWRYVVRIANINVTSGAVTATNLLGSLVMALNKVPAISGAGNSPPPGAPGGTETRPGQVNWGLYCNRAVRTALDIQAMARSNCFLTVETRDGRPYTAFRGVPIRICDQIVNDEANVM